MTGADYCLTHDPASAATIAAARSKGGHARHGRKVGVTGAGPVVNLATPGDVLHVLQSELRGVLGLEVSLSRARTVVAVCDSWVSCFSGTEFERRLAALERRADERV